MKGKAMGNHPVFAQPPCVTPFLSEREFVSFLKEYGVPYEEWGEKERSKIWKEVCEGDAVYSVVAGVEGPIPIRCILVIAIRVMLHHATLGLHSLIEYVREGSMFVPRRRKNSSLSEKVIVNTSTGVAVETMAQTAQRCYIQETGLSVSIEEFDSGPHGNFIFMPYTADPYWQTMTEFDLMSPSLGMGSESVELDFGSSHNKYRGLPTFRQVAHYIHYLPELHYSADGYVDEATNYLSQWCSVSKAGSAEPIPAHLVPHLKRASA